MTYLVLAIAIMCGAGIGILCGIWTALVEIKTILTELLKNTNMIRLEYFNGKEWVFVQEWVNETLAWVSLGGDDFNYRTVDKNGNVLTDKSFNNDFQAYLKNKQPWAPR